MRSASPRCAIEKIAIRGLPAGVHSMRPTSSGLALHPGAEARRREQVVEPHGELEALLGRIERLEVEDADARHRRRLDRLDQRGQVEVASLAPGGVEDGRDQDVLAALDGSASMPRRPSRLVAVLAMRSRKSSPSSRIAGGGAAKDLRIEIGMPASLPGV